MPGSGASRPAAYRRSVRLRQKRYFEHAKSRETDHAVRCRAGGLCSARALPFFRPYLVQLLSRRSIGSSRNSSQLCDLDFYILRPHRNRCNIQNSMGIYLFQDILVRSDHKLSHRDSDRVANPFLYEAKRSEAILWLSTFFLRATTAVR